MIASFGPLRVLGRELSEILSPFYWTAKANSPSLLQNSVSSLLRDSTFETVSRPFPTCHGLGQITRAGIGTREFLSITP